MRRRHPRGSVLIVVCVMLAIVAGLIAVGNASFRQQNIATHRFLYGEVALHLARAALEEADTYLTDRGLVSREEPAGRLLLTRPAGEVEKTWELELPTVERLVDGLPGGAKVRAMAQLAGFAPMLPRPAGGISPDPLEKRGEAVLLAEATYGGVTRRVIVRREVSVVNLVPPVVTRFVLFCRGESPLTDEELNGLSYDAVTRRFFSGSPAVEASPLVVSSVEPASPRALQGLRDGGGLEALAPGPDPAAGKAAGTGWVFLGGPRPWVMNLTLGPGVGNPLEEGHLLRRVEFVTPSPVLPGFEEKTHLFGFAEGVLDSPMFRGQGRAIRGLDGRLPEGTSALHLSGDLTAATPPLVLGRVHRRFLRFIKLRRPPAAAFDSFGFAPDAMSFVSAGERFRLLTGRGYDDYARFMPQPVVEPYNRCHDYLVTSHESSEAERPYRIDAGATPASPAAQLTGDRVADLLRPLGPGRAFFLYPELELESDRAGATPVRILRPGRGEGASETVFAGDLNAFDAFVRVMLARTTCRVRGATPQQALMALLSDGDGGLELSVPGVVHLGSGDLVVPRLRVKRGGQLMVDGTLTVEGGIETEPGEPLTLVSLSGDVRVATPERIRAALLAPAGEVLFPPGGGVDILGAVMSGTLARLPASCRGPERRRLTWDAALDSLDPASWANGYRVFLGARRGPVLERSD